MNDRLQGFKGNGMLLGDSLQGFKGNGVLLGDSLQGFKGNVTFSGDSLQGFKDICLLLMTVALVLPSRMFCWYSNLRF